MNGPEISKILTTRCMDRMASISIPRGRRIISFLSAFFLFGPSALAQPDDWRAVEKLELGSRLTVKARQNYFCFLDRVTPDQLTCETLERPYQGSSIVTIPRSDITEVRLWPHYNQAKDAWIGAGIGAAAGGAAAASQSTDSLRAVHRFFGAVAGAGAGALVGATVPIFQLAFHHRGKLIYKR